MLYAIISEDVANSLSKRLSVRPAHLERLQNLRDQGRINFGWAASGNRFQRSR